jgi:hypothetical protein
MSMLLEELIFEMSKSINAISIDLDEFKNNKKHALAFLKDTDRELVQEYTNDVNLYEIGNRFILIDEKRVRVLYYMEWKEIFHKFVNHKAASQVLVWRDKSVPGYTNVAAQIFFDYLLPKFSVVITDALQSPDGQNFWIRRVSDAFERGLNVYYLGLLPTSKEINRELIKINSSDDFENLNAEKNFWGETEKFKARKILISNIEIE